MKPYYEQDGITIYHGDCREIWQDVRPFAGCLVIDPPYDDMDLVLWSNELPRHASDLVFTDPRYIGHVILARGDAPTWTFTWDTMAPWSLGPHRPLNQSRFCLWYGALGSYNRDAVLWGEPPPARNHPTTKQVPLDGRRMTDLWRESLRWLHNPSAGEGSVGVERFNKTLRKENAMRHAKPLGWVRCLIGNTSIGPVFDPFMGSGTALRAAKDLGRRAVGIDIDEGCCEVAAKRLAQGALDLFGEQTA